MGLGDIEAEEEQETSDNSSNTTKNETTQMSHTSLSDRTADHDPSELVKDERWVEANVLEDYNDFGEYVGGLPPDVRGVERYKPPEELDWREGWYDATGVVVISPDGKAKLVPCRCGSELTMLIKQRAVMCNDCRSVVIDPQWFDRGDSLVRYKTTPLRKGWELRASHQQSGLYRVMNDDINMCIQLKIKGDRWLCELYKDVKEKDAQTMAWQDNMVEQNHVRTDIDKHLIPDVVINRVNNMAEKAEKEANV